MRPLVRASQEARAGPAGRRGRAAEKEKVEAREGPEAPSKAGSGHREEKEALEIEVEEGRTYVTTRSSSLPPIEASAS